MEIRQPARCKEKISKPEFRRLSLLLQSRIFLPEGAIILAGLASPGVVEPRRNLRRGGTGYSVVKDRSTGALFEGRPRTKTVLGGFLHTGIGCAMRFWELPAVSGEDDGRGYALVEVEPAADFVI
jgi:hypothetical protein